MKLYQFSISPNAKRTRVIANELGIKLDIEELDFRKGQHKTPDYMKLNPNGKVPTLVDDDGTTVWESPATLVYLAAKQPDAFTVLAGQAKDALANQQQQRAA